MILTPVYHASSANSGQENCGSHVPRLNHPGKHGEWSVLGTGKARSTSPQLREVPLGNLSHSKSGPEVSSSVSKDSG